MALMAHRFLEKSGLPANYQAIIYSFADGFLERFPDEILAKAIKGGYINKRSAGAIKAKAKKARRRKK